jgi:putative transposase
MHWLCNTHVRRYHKHHKSSGHIWQGRFKAFPIEHDEHLLTVLRYVERNALRAGLVKRAELWPWCSVTCGAAGDDRPVFWHKGPIKRHAEWIDWVNAPATEAELARIRECITRGRPYGHEAWQRLTAGRLGLESTLRPRGRPRKTDIAKKKLGRE